jgi:hypothetical protein
MIGLVRWEMIRAEWLRPKIPLNRRLQVVEHKKINAETIIERIFSQNGNWQLSEPVPLSQMVDILIDFWEAEGLYES